jgi:hypothetical protein
MLKGNFVRAAIVLGALTLTGTNARADEAGCAALASGVKAAVAAAARSRDADQFESSGAGRRDVLTLSGRYTCSATAAVASRAFGEALRGMNFRLAWNGDWIRPGDYCLSHHLDQCYPSHDRFSPLPPPSEFAFVQRTWGSVTRALASQMPYGIDGDFSNFSDASLDSALSEELRTSVSGSLRNAMRDRGAPRH